MADFLALDDALDLVEALRAATRARDGWVHGTGEVEDAELRVSAEGPAPRRRCPGRWTLVSLSGPAGGPYGVVLARDGAEVRAGHLVHARARGVHVVLLPAASTPGGHPGVEPAAARALAPGTPALRSEPPGGQGAGSTSGWAAAAAAVAARLSAAQPTEGEEPFPEPGDRVDHPKFGPCDVLKVNGDRLYLRDRQGPGRIREIATSPFRLERVADREGRRVFRLERR